MGPSSLEVYMLELINAERAGRGAQPLAFDADLNQAADRHSQWMLGNDVFSHRGAGGSTAGDRMESAGYDFSRPWTWGENIGWYSERGAPGLKNEVEGLHEDLMESPGHRANILKGAFSEIGVGFDNGEFRNWDAAMVTQNFAQSGTDRHLTGVTFDDADGDRDYDPGEALGGVKVTVRGENGGVWTTESGAAGAYALELRPGDYEVTFSHAGETDGTHRVQVGDENVKLDLDDAPRQSSPEAQPVEETPEPPQTRPEPPSPEPEPTAPDNGSPGLQAIAELGSERVDHDWTTLDLDRSFDDPVVFVSAPTINGGQPVTTRVKTERDGDLAIRLQEPKNLDDWHAIERVDFMVIEAGRWTLEDGTRLEVGAVETDRLTSRGFDNVRFEGDFDAAPTVLTQIQTFRGSDFAVARQRNEDADGFQFAMQESEANNAGGHKTETVGYLAVESGAGAFGEAGTLDGVSDRGASAQFAPSAPDAPFLFTSLASYNGDNTAMLRLDDASDNGFSVHVQEETTRDEETSHLGESVDYLALAQSDLTASDWLA